MHDELARLDATAQAALVRDGAVSPTELVDAAITRIERVDPALNAVIHPLFEKAREAARSLRDRSGPFPGVPMLLKDLDSHSRGDPYHAGMRVLREARWIAPRDSHLVERFRAAGFVVVGKTNTPELGLLPTTEPEAYGPTRNPWDTNRSTGGSSGGSGAAVAAGMVPVAHASDGGGSIRIPASECGLVGLKPSRGRSSLGPENGQLWSGMVSEHVLTRSVRDTAAVLDAVAGVMTGDPYCAPTPTGSFRSQLEARPAKLRVGLMTTAPALRAQGFDVHPDCRSAAEQTARVLSSLGHRVEPEYPSALDEADFGSWIGAIITSWTAHALDRWGALIGRKIGAADVEIGTWTLAELGRTVTGTGYVEALTALQAYTYRVASWFDRGFDLLVTPTCAEPPPMLGQLRGTPEDPMKGLLRSIPIATFTSPFNATGQPAVSLPLGWSREGLPIGVQLVAPLGREDLLIRTASQLEEVCPWADRWPPVHA